MIFLIGLKMASVYLQNVSLSYPIYGASSRSIKNFLINKVATNHFISKDSIIALNSINLDIKSGDRIGLFGPNGSGKSTLLKVISGIYKTKNGICSVDGRTTSLLSISSGMDFNGTGIDNIFSRGFLLGMSYAEISSLKDKIIEFSGLGNFINLPIRMYSSGMQMRLGFAISVFSNPEILIMDEWLSVGDEEFSVKANNKLNSMINDSNILIIASHNLDLLKNICNNIVHLSNGSITNIEKII